MIRNREKLGAVMVCLLLRSLSAKAARYAVMEWPGAFGICGVGKEGGVLSYWDRIALYQLICEKYHCLLLIFCSIRP